jgi:hypothetical protein
MLTILYLLFFVLALGFVGYSANGLRHYTAKKDMGGQLASVLCIALGVFGGYFFVSKLIKSLPAPVSATAITTQPKPVPLTQVSDTDEIWIVASQFEPVDYTSLYVAQAHRPGEHGSINRFVFLDTRACMGQSIRIPSTGEKFKVLMYSLRIGIGSPNVVVEKPASTMFFVRPPCR